MPCLFWPRYLHRHPYPCIQVSQCLRGTPPCPPTSISCVLLLGYTDSVSVLHFSYLSYIQAVCGHPFLLRGLWPTPGNSHVLAAVASQPLSNLSTRTYDGGNYWTFLSCLTPSRRPVSATRRANIAIVLVESQGTVHRVALLQSRAEPTSEDGGRLHLPPKIFPSAKRHSPHGGQWSQ